MPLGQDASWADMDAVLRELLLQQVGPWMPDASSITDTRSWPYVLLDIVEKTNKV